MNRRTLFTRRARLSLAQLGLIVALCTTTYVTRRQTALLASAAPFSTAQPPVATPVEDATAPPVGPAVGVAAGSGTVINAVRFSYQPNWYAPAVQEFLNQQPGPLKSLRVPVGNRDHSFAEFLVSQTSLYSLNPQVVLALLEAQSGVISSPNPSQSQMDWAMGYHGENEHWRGLVPQTRWAIRELRRGIRDLVTPPELVYADGSHGPPPPTKDVGEYALTRVMAATTGRAELPARLVGGDRSFAATFRRWFGDPLALPSDLPAPAAPFLRHPADKMSSISSFFDHDLPLLRENGTVVTYRGDRSRTISYDGHTGWDYAMRPPDAVLAAAAGTVVFAGNSNDGCGIAHAVILDHGNGYRTLYWHLSEISVASGPVAAGQQIGVVGSSGCATGPHLHFEVQYLGRDVDPYGWCGPTGTDPWANYPAGQVSTWLWSWMPSPCALPRGTTVVSVGDAAFHRSGTGWEERAGGLGGTALRVTSVPTATTSASSAEWQPDLPSPGRYRVLAWVPYIDNGLPDAQSVQYTISAGSTVTATLDQSLLANSWADLGVHDWPARGGRVRLDARDGSMPAGGTNIWVDAVVWIKQP
ncbi:MAG: peptidoglycan DD-metalloendopeptidase family protein [Herpetosiphon sp.]